MSSLDAMRQAFQEISGRHEGLVCPEDITEQTITDFAQALLTKTTTQQDARTLTDLKAKMHSLEAERAKRSEAHTPMDGMQKKIGEILVTLEKPLKSTELDSVTPNSNEPLTQPSPSSVETHSPTITYSDLHDDAHSSLLDNTLVRDLNNYARSSTLHRFFVAEKLRRLV